MIGAASRESGIGLLEAMIALALVMFTALSLASMTGMGMLLDHGSVDATLAATVAGDRMEQVRLAEYHDIAVGGSLDSDEAGFAETVDTDGDGAADYGCRWEVIDLGGLLQIRVRAFALSAAVGPARQVTLVTLRAARVEP